VKYNITFNVIVARRGRLLAMLETGFAISSLRSEIAAMPLFARNEGYLFLTEIRLI
jgi:hypothetical protein